MFLLKAAHLSPVRLWEQSNPALELFCPKEQRVVLEGSLFQELFDLAATALSLQPPLEGEGGGHPSMCV